MLSHLFNLGAQTGPWTSAAAARDFWTVFAVGVVLAAVYFGYRAIRARRRHHGQPFGHSF
ncbi:MAG: hypothetical protein ABSH03_05360 [Candidatus Lustribacter sp.]|jgi:hypothetical protein